jgi:uncharacterized membrane protein
MRIAAVLLVCLIAGPAAAGLQLCNRTERPVRSALGYFNGADWISRGWWTIAPKACVDLRPGPLDARYYYVYATDGSPGSWAGRFGFCVAASEHFSISGRADCNAHGYDRKGFFELDTGQARDYTRNLSD